MKFHEASNNNTPYKIFTMVLAFCFSSCFNLFETERKTLAKINLNAHSIVEADLVATGTTTKDVIQIVFINGNYSKVIGVYESYDRVGLIKLPNDSLLVKLSDSAGTSQYIDSQYIKLPSEASTSPPIKN